MSNPESSWVPGHLLQARFGGLLTSASRVLRGELQLWSPLLNVIFTVPSRVTTARPVALRDAVSRAAAQHATILAQTPEGRQIFAVPVRTRQGLAAVITLAAYPVRPARAAAAPDLRQTGGIETQQLFLEDLARTLGQHLDLLLECSGMADELASNRTELDLLHRVSERLAHPRNTGGTFEFILEQCRVATGADAALLWLPNTRTTIVTYNPAVGAAHAWLRPRTLRQISEQIAARLQGISPCSSCGALSEMVRGPLPVAEPVQVAIAQLKPGAHRTGFLCLLRCGEIGFRRQDLGLLESLAEQAVLAARGGEMYDDLHDFLLATVRALVSTIEAKDSCTSGHSTRVHLLSMLLGKELGLGERELESLKWASILHDVGKIGMPESILKKPGRLTEQEFEVVKQHPQRGYQVLSHVHQLQDASQAVLLHHERYDGGGYPLGISGDGIPRPARIIAVADTFDALTSERPYRMPLSEDEAFAEIQRVRGRQLDPQAVDALQKMLPFLRENLVMIADPPKQAA